MVLRREEEEEKDKGAVMDTEDKRPEVCHRSDVLLVKKLGTNLFSADLLKTEIIGKNYHARFVVGKIIQQIIAGARVKDANSAS